MIDKIKALLPKSSLAILFILVVYFAYVQYEAKERIESEYNTLKDDVTTKENLIIKYNQASQQAELQKLELENKSLELQGQINELLKDNKCANELVPNDVANKLYERVNQIRQTATNTSKPIK